MESISDNYESNKKSLVASDKNKLHTSLESALSQTSKTKNISNSIKDTKDTKDIKDIKDTNKNSKRCNFISCKKKLGIMPYDCKCGGQFCGLHQYGWEHKCTFNFKEENKDLLSNRLVKLEKSKLNKI